MRWWWSPLVQVVGAVVLVLVFVIWFGDRVDTGVGP